MNTRLLLSAAAIGALVAGGATPSMAQNDMAQDNTAANGGVVDQSALNDAQTQLRNATQTVNNMTQDPQMRNLLAHAEGVFVIPSFTRGGLIVGGRGGEGVLMVHRADGSWSGPSFYNIGGISIGAQAGVSSGPVAFLLMTDAAVKHFLGNNNFSLNAGAGLSIVNYSANAQSSWGKGDIIFWTNTAGAYAGATVSGTDINWDKAETQAFFRGQNINEVSIVNGNMQTPYNNPMEQALPSAT